MGNCLVFDPSAYKGFTDTKKMSLSFSLGLVSIVIADLIGQQSIEKQLCRLFNQHLFENYYQYKMSQTSLTAGMDTLLVMVFIICILGKLYDELLGYFFGISYTV